MARTNDFRLLVLLAGAALVAVLLMLVAAGKPARAAFPGTNGKMAFVSDRDSTTQVNDDIYVTDGNGSTPSRLTNNPAIDQFPAVSPNGKEVAFASDRDGNYGIYVMDAKDDDGDGNGDNLRLLYASAFTPQDYSIVNSISWSPDGKRIAFVSDRVAPDSDPSVTADREIFLVNADGSEPPTMLTNNTAPEGSPVFSPDGAKIAFNTSRDGNSEVYLMDSRDGNGDGNGDNPVRLTYNPATDYLPELSPDGSKIAFTSNRTASDGSTDSDIWVMDNAPESATTSATTNVPIDFTNDMVVPKTTTPTQERYPAWSPEGDQIAFYSGTGFLGFVGAEIWLMNPNGSDRTNLTNNPAGDIEPDWGPAPQKKGR